MNSKVRAALLAVAALLAALVISGLSSTTASAPQAAACEKHEKDAKGCTKDAESSILFDGSTPLITGRVQATQRGNDPFNVTGYGSAVVTLSAGVITGEGPVVCLDVRGNTVGGVIRFAKSSIPTAVGMDMYATFIDGGPGGTNDRVAVAALPVPPSTTTSCAPQPNIALAPFLSGDVTIKDGKLSDKK